MSALTESNIDEALTGFVKRSVLTEPLCGERPHRHRDNEYLGLERQLRRGDRFRKLKPGVLSSGCCASSETRALPICVPYRAQGASLEL